MTERACGELTPHRMRVQSPAEAVRAVLRARGLAHIAVAEPRVRVEEASATVDLRLRPEAKGSLATLAPCEQRALLGAIRQTLRANPQWGISRVVFLEKGNLLAI
jgi:hypothetical protein